MTLNRSAKHPLYDYKGEILNYNKAIEINPLSINVYFNRGLSLRALLQNEASCNDMLKAAELGSKQKNTMIQNQNNFIQINNTVLSQDKIKELSPDQLKQIEVIIQGCGVK